MNANDERELAKALKRIPGPYGTSDKPPADDLNARREAEERETARMLRDFPPPWSVDMHKVGATAVVDADGGLVCTASPRICRLIVSAVNYRATRERLGVQGDVEALEATISALEEARVERDEAVKDKDAAEGERDAARAELEGVKAERDRAWKAQEQAVADLAEAAECSELHRAQARARVEELEAADRWIPVGERLPEPEDYVLVMTVTGRVTAAAYDSLGGLGVPTGFTGMGRLSEVTHWRPLPAPPDTAGKEAVS